MRSRKVPTKKVELKPFVLWVRAVRKTDLGLSLGESVWSERYLDKTTAVAALEAIRAFDGTAGILDSRIGYLQKYVNRGRGWYCPAERNILDCG